MAVSPLSISDEDILKDEPQKLLSPSNPTPEETIFLSNIDVAVAFTVETVYFFEDGSAAEMSRIVKRALAILLVPYYFLAGRFQTNRESGRLELACNNAGVVFVNAKSKVRMRDLGDLSLPNPSFGRFVHRPGLHTNLHERALFTVQVTEFVCGGYAIGMVTNHGVLDGKSAAEMFQNLASICRGGGDLKPQTIFNDRTIFRARNPPLISHPHQEYTPFSPTLKQLPSSFTALNKPSPTPSPPMSASNHLHSLIPFTPSTIATLKNAAAPIPCSTFEAILSQLWRARTRAVYSDRPGETSMVLFAVDVRSKIRPVLPDGFVGNAVVTGFAAARAAEVVERPFSFCVERVKEGIERVSGEEYVRSAIDWLEVYRGIPATCNGKSFYVSAWWKLPFKELDFGFGKPVHVSPVANGNDEFVLLLSPANGGESGGGRSRGSVNVWQPGNGANGPYGHGGYPPQPGSATRTTSMASSNSEGPQRTMSMASTVTIPVTPADSDASTVIGHRPSMSKSGKSIDSDRPPTGKIRAPLVYPAMLSRVAECFKHKIILGDRTKNELAYKDAFSGAEAVDVLSYIIRTTDRNLALLLGRALDAQKFFHDVTYEHRLRDSTSEMYQFRENLLEQPEEKSPVNGVFVLLSECYSPTCTRDNLCYSIACPRRLEQVSRLNLKMQPGLKKEDTVLTNEDDADQTDEQKLWINSVPAEVAEKVDDKEKKRQEVISEICYTERDFVKDLEYLRDFWILPLRSKASPIPANRRERVVKAIFSNIIDHPSLHLVSSRFARALTERQQKDPVVDHVGDIFLEFVPQFEPFIWYGSKQMEAKHEFENEKAINPLFAKFVDEIERRKESRKLELNGYLTKPTTRLARYPLLLEAVLKHSKDGNSDKEDLPKVLVTIRDFLFRVNQESGKAENRFQLKKLQESLRFRPNERMDLRLTEDGREIIFKSQLRKTPNDASQANEITAYLFDHAVLLVRIKQNGKVEETKAYRRPIPLELLAIREMEEVIPQNGIKRSSSSLLPLNAAGVGKKSEGWPITFRHLGKAGYELTLYASNQVGREKWLKFIDTAQKKLRSRADFFNTTVISSGHFVGTNRINCVTPCDGGRKLIYGTDTGIYVSDRKNKDSPPKRVIETAGVTQIDVLEEYGLLLVLSNKVVYSYPTSALDPNEAAPRPKKIQSHCNFFKTGICLGRHLVCCVKSSALSTTIKVYEPTDAFSKGKKQKGFGKMFAGQDELKPFKEFYIPTESSSVHFLKSKLCVACARGFEVVSLETLETQSLLDQADTSLDFVARKESVRPIHIERLNGEFLLNYSEFSFFVNRNGWRARPDWCIYWEGAPHSFALSYPWILAFEANFIELRHIESGAVHIVPHKNIRMLHSSTHEILFAYEDERGDDVVEALDFWKNNRRSDAPLQDKETMI